MTDRYSGDPRIIIGPNGWTLDFEGGQPIMDQGIENQALLSLFVRPGWCGNLFLSPASRIGSDFLDVCARPLTMKAITADIPNAITRALKGDLFPDVQVSVTNVQSYDLRIVITLSPGQALTLDRRGMLWQAQASNPASGRLVKTA